MDELLQRVPKDFRPLFRIMRINDDLLAYALLPIRLDLGSGHLRHLPSRYRSQLLTCRQFAASS